jgi:hypothetical protein
LGKYKICSSRREEALTSSVVEQTAINTKAIRQMANSFDFAHDTFAFPNELMWEYRIDPTTGKTTTHKNNPPPTYAHHCFVVVRAAKQFLLHAQFERNSPPLTDVEYSARVRDLMRRSPQSPSGNKVIIPGFGNLRDFSAAKKQLLQSNCGGAWQSYVQRGNWRMVFPFSRSHQEHEAKSLVSGISTSPIVHIVTFPRLSINHAILLFEATDNEDRVEFRGYDPNIVERPVSLFFDKNTRTFHFPATHYFAGGDVNVYQIYRGWLY